MSTRPYDQAFKFLAERDAEALLLLLGGARRLSEVAEPSQQQELSLHFLLLGGLRYNREHLLELIGRKGMIPIEQLKESSFYQYILEEGRQEGRQAGRQEGEAAMLRRQLERRVGSLPEWAVTKIEAADQESLLQWGMRVLDATSVREVLGEAESD